MAPQNILALSDLGECSDVALVWAGRLAARAGGTVTAGYVATRLDEMAPFAGGDKQNAQRLADWVLEEDRRRLREQMRKHVPAERIGEVELQVTRSVRDGVHDLIERVSPDLITVGTHGRTGLKHALLGSIAEHTIRTAGRPVMVCKGHRALPVAAPCKVLVAVDFEDRSLDLAQRAAALLKPEDRMILGHVVESAYWTPNVYGLEYALPQPDVPRLIEASMMQLRKIADKLDHPDVECRVASGRPGPELVKLHEETGADWTVVSTHGRRGFDRFVLGSVAEYLARKSPGSLLVLPKAE